MVEVLVKLPARQENPDIFQVIWISLPSSSYFSGRRRTDISQPKTRNVTHGTAAGKCALNSKAAARGVKQGVAAWGLPIDMGAIWWGTGRTYMSSPHLYPRGNKLDPESLQIGHSTDFFYFN